LFARRLLERAAVTQRWPLVGLLLLRVDATSTAHPSAIAANGTNAIIASRIIFSPIQASAGGEQLRGRFIPRSCSLRGSWMLLRPSRNALRVRVPA